jgi:hypothetical protein
MALQLLGIVDGGNNLSPIRIPTSLVFDKDDDEPSNLLTGMFLTFE